jgi:PilZ domain
MNETQTQEERRKSKRFRLRLAVVFSWRDERGALQSGEGCSCDISGRGIYVRTGCAPAAGNVVEMNVFLPQPAYDIRAAEIHAKGQVMRVDQGRRGQVCGFAAMNRSVVIREPIAQALDERGAEPRPSLPPQRIASKQDAGLGRS